MAAIDIVTEGLTATGDASGFEEQTIISIMPNAIDVLLGSLGIVGLIFMIYSGILYLTSQGNKDTVEKARKILIYSTVGMVVIIASYAIVNYLLGGLRAILEK